MCPDRPGSHTRTMSIENHLAVGPCLLLEPDGGERLKFLGHDETSYVVEGSYELTFGTEQVNAEPGAFLYVPRGRPHTFRNAGDGLGRIVGTFVPARFAEYFRELAEIIERTRGPPGREQWAELYGRYDTTVLDDA
jgi:hypothetical protein